MGPIHEMMTWCLELKADGDILYKEPYPRKVGCSAVSRKKCTTWHYVQFFGKQYPYWKVRALLETGKWPERDAER